MIYNSARGFIAPVNISIAARDRVVECQWNLCHVCIWRWEAEKQALIVRWGCCQMSLRTKKEEKSLKGRAGSDYYTCNFSGRCKIVSSSFCSWLPCEHPQAAHCRLYSRPCGISYLNYVCLIVCCSLEREHRMLQAVHIHVQSSFFSSGTCPPYFPTKSSSLIFQTLTLLQTEVVGIATKTREENRHKMVNQKNR